MTIREFITDIENGKYDEKFRTLYGTAAAERQRARYIKAAGEFAKCYPQHEKAEISVFSAPGRTEIGGNHTDHQHGCVLAAAVNLDVIAFGAFHDEGVIRVSSEGYDPFEVSLSDLSVHEDKKGSSEIVRGIAAKFTDMGINIGGFDIYTTSDVIGGSGISSSAAFETLIGTIIDCHYNSGNAGAVEIAKIGQYAENVYFGKKSGLMDQMVSSVGGLVAIDFNDTENPGINSFKCDFEQFGYCICITDTKGSHADLTDDYVAVRAEMESIAEKFGKKYLREVNEDEFYKAVPELRKSCGDRAALRASHFFSENLRAVKEAEALSNDEFEYF
ncbi:MAG: galactokinase, partial [Ruminococcus sp.]